MTNLEQSLAEELRLVRRELNAQTKLIDTLCNNVQLLQDVVRDKSRADWEKRG